MNITGLLPVNWCFFIVLLTYYELWHKLLIHPSGSYSVRRSIGPTAWRSVGRSVGLSHLVNSSYPLNPYYLTGHFHLPGLSIPISPSHCINLCHLTGPSGPVGPSHPNGPYNHISPSTLLSIPCQWSLTSHRFFPFHISIPSTPSIDSSDPIEPLPWVNPPLLSAHPCRSSRPFHRYHAVHPSVQLPVNQSINQSISQSACQTIF